MNQGFDNALKNFQRTAATVPAYKDFLKKNRIDSSKIKLPSDFEKVPWIDKKNYLKTYPFHSLFPNEQIPPMVSVSSGSSGEPFYWPRNEDQEREGGVIHERIFKHIFGIDNKKTLAIICFSMGTWVAGTFTTSSCRWISKTHNNLTTITPGIEKEDTIAILKNFAPNFEKIILCGYPPFIMDIVREAVRQQIDLRRLGIRYLFAGENFSEKWRDTIHELAGISNPYFGSTSIYGTADAAVLGHETPFAIYIRRLADGNSDIKNSIFPESNFLPTLVQYYPSYKYFEKVGNEVVFTAETGLPLVRYNIHDHGGLITFKEMTDELKKTGNLNEATEKNLTSWEMPFIYLTGRPDVATSFYAVNIYPENIKQGLETVELKKMITGKFIAQTKLDENQFDQELIISVELECDIEPTEKLNQTIVTSIFKSLKELNAEYRKLNNSIGEKAARPTVKLIPFGDPSFQVKKSKHKWINKN